MLPLQGMWVLSLVRELRSCKLCGMVKQKKIPELNSYSVVGLRFESGKFGSTVHFFNEQHGASPNDVKEKGQQRQRRGVPLGAVPIFPCPGLTGGVWVFMGSLFCPIGLYVCFLPVPRCFDYCIKWRHQFAFPLVVEHSSRTTFSLKFGIYFS